MNTLIEVKAEDNKVIVRVFDSVISDPPLLTDLKEEIISAAKMIGPDNVVVDFDRVIFVASSWLGCMMEIRGKQGDGKITFCNLCESVYSILELSGVGSVFNLVRKQ